MVLHHTVQLLVSQKQDLALANDAELMEALL